MILPNDINEGAGAVAPATACSTSLKAWASDKLAEVKGRAIKAGDKVKYAGSVWVVAHVKQFPHGPMIGIYDQPPGKHVDYIKPGSVTLIP
jgi:hypothetical protein